MLSPASHRVCCLAVMAPALTKGDSRTDCLPVELSGPYCITEKASTIREDNKYLNGFRASHIAHLLKNKQLMNRAGVPKDNRSAEVHDQRKSFVINGKIRFYAETNKSKPWHAPSATLAVAGKVKSKYIMIKANGSNKSMGLVRGNTALALQSIKTMNSKRNNSSNKTCETQTPSPDLPDTTNSELELNTQIPSMRTVHPTLEPSNEEVSSSCGDLLTVCPDPVLDALSKSVQNENCTLVSLQDGTSVSPREDNLIVSTVNEDLSYKNFIKDILSKPSDCSPLVEGGTVPHNGNDNVAEDEVDSPPTNCTNSNSKSVLIPTSNVNNSSHATSGEQAQFQSEVEDIPSIMTASSPLDWQTDVDLKSPVISADFSDSECAPEDIIPSSPLSQSDIETASASCSITSSSTLSANNSNSPAHSFEEDLPAPVRLTFPDEFLGTILPSVDRGTLPTVDSVELCCPLDTQDVLSLSEKLRQQELRLEEGLKQTEELMRQQLVPHVRLQLAAVTAMLRHEGGFQCQRPARSSIVHRDRGVKDPSMAALVDFVRRIETCPAPRQIVGAEVSEPTLSWVTGDSKDLAVTRHALERKVRSLLVTVDPDLTDESSEEESSDVEDQLESSGSQRSALWTYLCERASLTRRSTWLLARIHELENQMRSLRRHSSTPLQLGPGGSCRLRPLLTPHYRRPILSTLGVHHEEGDSRLARLSSLPCSCSCADDRLPCVLCTGRYNCAMGVDPDATTLRDRVALLHPDYHPLLSEDQDIPLLLHFESIFKKNEDQYQKVRPVSPSNSARLQFGNKEHYPSSSSQRKFSRYSRSYFTSKYRNNNKKHFRKNKLVFGKWRKLQNKSSFHRRNRFRRLSIPSSDSSIEDSPLSSPMSPSEDGFMYDGRRRRDDSNFDFDDVIIPFGNKGGRVQKYEVKDIEIPSWRRIDIENYEFSDSDEQEEEEDTSDGAYIKRHASYEAEERKIVRSGGDTLRFFNTWEKRTAQLAAAKKGQTVPEFLNNHKTMFPDGAQEGFMEEVAKISEEEVQEDLLEPILPAEDSQEPSRSIKRARQDGGDSADEAEEDPKRPRLDEAEEDANKQFDEDPTEDESQVLDVLPPYEPLQFPLSDEAYQQLLEETDYLRPDGGDLNLDPAVLFDPPPPLPAEEPIGEEDEEEYCGGSTTTTVEEDIEDFEEEDDPEWVVINKDSGGGEQAPLVLKFAKR